MVYKGQMDEFEELEGEFLKNVLTCIRKGISEECTNISIRRGISIQILIDIVF